MCASADVAAYVRVSTRQQKDEGSHERQRERIREWAREHDHTVDFYEDLAVSGAAENRAGYHELMDAYEEYDAVVVRELSRWGRGPEQAVADILEITGGMDSDGTDFISLKEDGMFDTTSANGRLFLRIMSAMNGYYSEYRREQALEAAERRREQGKQLGRPKKLDAEHRAEARELDDKGVSYSAIARIMEDKASTPDSISRETIRRYCNEA